MNNASKILKLVGFIVIILVFFNNIFDYSRLLIILLGILILFISLFIKENGKVRNMIFIPFITLILSIILDSTLAYYLNYSPIFAYEIKSSDNFITYNSIGYRIFKCDSKSYKDLFYKKSDYCNSNLLEIKDINALSSEIVENFNEYKNKFFVIEGKVSYKEGNNKIELKSYNNDENNINGNVIFNNNIVYKIDFNNLNNIDNLKLYDNVKIVGRISKVKEKDDVYTVTVKDAYIPNDKLYNNYSMNVVDDKKCQKDKTEYVKTKDNNYYTSCLTNIYVVYDENDVYELSYVLKDEKINLKDLLVGYKDKKEKEMEDGKNILYTFNNYNILVCNDNKTIIIGNDKLDLESNYCQVADVNTDDL